jgi:HPt (histidine-containing phosphotransfer) domain-containing protein
MTSEAFKRHFEKASADYRRRLPSKLAELDTLWDALTSGSVLPAKMVSLQRELHTLAGTAQTMGFPAVTHAARAAESFLEQYAVLGALPGPAAQSEFRTLLDALKRAAE